MILPERTTVLEAINETTLGHGWTTDPIFRLVISVSGEATGIPSEGEREKIRIKYTIETMPELQEKKP